MRSAARLSRATLRMAAVLAVLLAGATAVRAQQLDTHFSCSTTVDDSGEKIIFADSGDVHFDGPRIKGFSWESSLFRSTHGFDCSIDESDGLAAETIGDEQQPAWRVRVTDPAAARERRGYDFATRMNCTIRIVRSGDRLEIKPSCPALCGSRMNFSELSVDLKTGDCRYDNDVLSVDRR
jgi:hypothetical protein